METNSFYSQAAAMIEQGDLNIFKIVTQTYQDDKIALLALQNIVRARVPGYTYLEVGSHLGGSLVPHLSDPRCGYAYSIDKRPLSQLDERGREFEYPENSTQAMVDGLVKHLPLASLLKLNAIDADVSALTTGDIALPCDLLFLDAEHTNQAVFRDFLSVRRFAKDSAIFAFHDTQYVFDAIANIETLLDFEGVKHHCLMLRGSIFVILIGGYADFAKAPLSLLAVDKTLFFAESKRALWREIAVNNLPLSLA